MELFHRKKLRLQDYDYSQNGAYFITICVKNKECILSNIVGRGAYTAPQIELSDYGRIVERYIKTMPGIEKYVIMPNHVHLIVCITENDGAVRAPHPTQSIPVRVGAMKSLVSKAIGHSIWQTSYHDHIIRNAGDYKMIWNYIDENPLRWEQDCFYVP